MDREEVWVKFTLKAMECKRAQGDKFDYYPVDYDWCARVGEVMLRKFDRQFPKKDTS